MKPLPANKKKSKQATSSSRRQFFRHVGTMVAGGALFSTGMLTSVPQAHGHKEKVKDTAMETARNNEFSPFVGDTFKIRIEGETSVPAKLVEVIDRTPHVNSNETEGNPTVRQECFSVLFTGPNDRPLDQGTFTFDHKKMGAVDIFIVPVGSDEQGMHYEAVFNRLVG